MPPKTPKAPPLTTGQRLNRALAERGVSQSELARRMGTSHAAVNQALQDQRAPSLEWLCRAAEALGVSPSELDDRLRK